VIADTPGMIEAMKQMGRNRRLTRPMSSTPSPETWPDWERIGSSIGNVSPMRPQCENTKVATCEPWIRRL
jgi:hypothetical protein